MIMTIKIRYKIAALLVLGIFSITGIGAYNNPADSYYNSRIAQGAPSAELPSQEYYNNHLRAGGDEWEDDDGPGGSGDGSNTGVGVPVDEAGIPALAACLLVYGIYARNKRRKGSDNSPIDEHTND